MKLARRLPLPAWLMVPLLIVRFVMAAEYQAPAGDGLQFLALSQELLQHHRYAYGSADSAPTYSRLPGYPLFLAYVAVRKAPVDLADHLNWAARWNVVCDCLTGIFLFLILRRLGCSWRATWWALLALAMFPTLAYLNCFGLCEAFATMLATATLYFALRVEGRGGAWWAAASGAFAGYAMLTRPDLCTAFIAPLVVLVWRGGDRRRRASLVATFAIGAAVVFAPWPLRNWRVFGAPHFIGAQWVNREGRPIPLGPMRWFATWATGKPLESYMPMRFANHGAINPEGDNVLLPQMYDSDAERERLIALLRRYNQERSVADVDAAFTELANERIRLHPFRYYVTLPLQRASYVFRPSHEWELPVKAPHVGLPAWRDHYDRVGFVVLIAAVLAALWVTPRHPIAALVLTAGAVARLAVFPFVHPMPTQRYFVEAVPLLVGCIALAVDKLASRRRTDVS